MSRRPRSLTARIRDHIGFSVVAIGVVFIVLRLLGVRSTFTGFAMSVGITLALNVGLSYFTDYRAKHPRTQPAPRGGDIRFRDDNRSLDDRRYDPRAGHDRSSRDRRESR